MAYCVKEVMIEGVGSLKIYYDEIGDNPIKDWGLPITVDLFGRYEHLGSDYRAKDYEGFKYLREDEYLRKLKKIEREGGIVLPVYAYEHSGIVFKTYPFSCPWDSGQAGFIYITKEQITEGLGYKPGEKGRRIAAKEYLKTQVAMLSAYANGEVYGFVLEDEEGEEVDSCWGFFCTGRFSDVIDDMKDCIEEKYHRLFDEM